MQQKTVLKTIYGETQQPGRRDLSGAAGRRRRRSATRWAGWITGPNTMVMSLQKAPSLRFAFGTEMFKYFIYNDPNWDYSTYDFATSGKTRRRRHRC